MLLAGRWWWQWTGPSFGTIPTSTMSSSPELLRYFIASFTIPFATTGVSSSYNKQMQTRP